MADLALGQSAAWTPTSSLNELDDRALLAQLKRFVGSSNQLAALMLAHLAEVDARAAYRQWACPTLFIYCVYELRLAEDEAQRLTHEMKDCAELDVGDREVAPVSSLRRIQG